MKTTKVLKTAAILGAGAAIGAVALTVYARKQVAAFIDDPDGTVGEETALRAGVIVTAGDTIKARLEEAGSWVADAFSAQKPGPTE